MRTLTSGGTMVMKNVLLMNLLILTNLLCWSFKISTTNEQQDWKEANINSKIDRNSTKRYQPIASRNKFQPIYTEPIDLKEDDAHTIDPQINNLATQSMRRPSPVANKYPDRGLLHHQIKNATTFIVPGNTDFNNAIKFG